MGTARSISASPLDPAPAGNVRNLLTPPPRPPPRKALAPWRIPFLVWVPSVVVVIGVVVAAVVTWLGVSELRAHSDRAAAFFSSALSQTLAERLSVTPELQRAELLERAAEVSGAELILVDDHGRVLADQSLLSPSSAGLVQLIRAGEGETTTSGRTRFSVAPIPGASSSLYLLAFVGIEERPFATASLVRLVSLFTLVLVGVAAVVAQSLARAVHSDVTYVRERLDEMARPDADPAGELIRIRTVDQVGLMTAAFNQLVERFTDAEQEYRENLSHALAYERDRSEFLAALSHELRTPLNGILGFTDILLSEADGPLSADARENLEIVRQSGMHLRSLINDILDLSALESGELQLDRKPTDVYQIAGQVRREAGVTAAQKGLTVELVGEGALAYADPLRVRQIIGNLVSNAIKFTSEGKITVNVQREGWQVKLSVSDTGPGIAGREQETIFEEYKQTGDPTVQRAGTGLGLAITRRLVRMHGGTIMLASEIGRGSTFTVRLPGSEGRPDDIAQLEGGPSPSQDETTDGDAPKPPPSRGQLDTI